MEESKRKWNDQKKMTLKVGGGGIGAVVLFGGALATAALASALVVGKKRRSSGKEHLRRRQSPPPEINKQDEEDKANKGSQPFILLDQPSDLYEHPSNGATKEVESDNDIALLASTQSSTLDEKPTVEEINGGTQDDTGHIEASEQIMCSISPKILETDAISNGSVVTEEEFPLLDEKLQFEPQNMMHEEDEVKIDHLTKQDIPNEISNESENLEQVHIEEESAERECSDDGEIEGTREEENNEVCYDQEEIKVIVVDNRAIEGVHHIDQTEAENNVNTKVDMEKREFEGFGDDNGEIISEERVLEANEMICNNQESMATDGSLSDNIFSESYIEDGQETLVPVFDSPVTEHENVNADEKEGPLDTKIVEIIQEDEQVKYNEAQMVKEEEENCDQPGEGIVAEKCKDPIEVKEDKIPCENGQFELPMLKEEQISTKEIEVTKEDDANEEVAESVELNGTSMQFVICQQKENEDNAKENIEKEAGEEMISPENIEVAEEDGVNEEVAELNETPMQFVVICQPTDNENDAKKNTEKEAGEELISPENIEVAKEDGVNEEVAESVELNETPMQFVICQPKDDENDANRNIEMEDGEELISPENIEVTKEDGINEEVAESVELNETSMQFVVICQPKDNENDAKENVAEEIEEELVSSEGVEVTKEDGVNNEVAESVEVNEYNTSKMQFVISQSKDHEDNLERNIEKKVDKELICPENVEVTNDDTTNEEADENKTSVEFVKDITKDDSVIEKRKNEDHTKDFNDEVQLIDQEVEGKIQEDKTVKKGEHDSKESRKIDEDSSFEPHQLKEESNFQKSSKTEKTSINKYIEMAMLRDHTTNSTSRRIMIATLSVLSSLSCSWLFGLSFVKLCFIVFFTMALSSMVTV